MQEREKKVIDSAGFYSSGYLPIDFMLAGFVYESIKPFFKGSLALELGPASGLMTKHLVNDFSTIHLIEGSEKLIKQVPLFTNAIMHCSMFEDFQTEIRFDTIIMSHVLEHVEDPVQLLAKVKNWLAPGGVVIIVVPNAESIHRIVAVKMGILDNIHELNDRDKALGHYRVYDMEILENHVMIAGLKVLQKGGSFLKPLTNEQIEKSWTTEMIRGFYETGKHFPDHCAAIFIVAS